MSLNVQASQASVHNAATNPNPHSNLPKPWVSKRWKLAERLSASSKIPYDILKEVVEPVFENIINDLEKYRPIPFESETKKRVWKNIANKMLKNIKEMLVYSTCDRILQTVLDQEVERMLEDETRMGKIDSIADRAILQSRFVSDKVTIKAAVRREMVWFTHQHLRQSIIVALQREDSFKALHQADQDDTEEERNVEPQLVFPKAMTPYIILSEASDDDEPS